MDAGAVMGGERGRRVACKQQEEEEDPEAGGRDSWKPFS